jgi:dolichol kinase
MVSLLLYRGFVGCNYNLFDLIIISILATVFEMVSIKGIDNLTIPCATAILYLILKG